MKKLLIASCIIILFLLTACGRQNSSVAQMGAFVEQKAQAQDSATATPQEQPVEEETPVEMTLGENTTANESADIQMPVAKSMNFKVTDDDNDMITELTCDFITPEISFKFTNVMDVPVTIYHGERPPLDNSVRISVNGRVLPRLKCEKASYDPGESGLCFDNNIMLRLNDEETGERGINKLTAIMITGGDLTLFECWA
jgi:hypothetical protein